jgi:hypothetical protein
MTFIEIHNTYLHGKYFLLWLHNDLIFLTPQQQSTVLSASSDSQVCRRMPLLEAVHYAQADVAFFG